MMYRDADRLSTPHPSGGRARHPALALPSRPASRLSVVFGLLLALAPGCRKKAAKKWTKTPVQAGIWQDLAPVTGTEADVAAWKAPPTRPILNRDFRFGWPLEDLNVTSPYGHRMHPVVHRVLFHRGVDLAAPRGTPVLAAGPGIVEFAGKAPLTGNTVILAHPGGIQTLYAHMDEILVTEGAVVAKRAVVGLVGSTGRSTGPHLHFQVNVAGRSVDPEDVLGRSPRQLEWYVEEVLRHRTSGQSRPEQYHGQRVP